MLFENQFEAVCNHRLTQKQVDLVRRACSHLDTFSSEYLQDPDLYMMMVLVKNAVEHDSSGTVFCDAVFEYFNGDGSPTDRAKAYLYDIMKSHLVFN